MFYDKNNIVFKF